MKHYVERCAICGIEMGQCDCPYKLGDKPTKWGICVDCEKTQGPQKKEKTQKKKK